MTLLLTRRELFVAGRKITFELPACQDELLAAAICQEDFGSAAGDPYWGSLWETAPRTAAMILQHVWPSRLNVLELGCGVGVVGIAALIAGHDVMFSDHVSAAVRLAISNAALNGYPEADSIVFDWQQPPCRQEYDLIIGSDVLYELASHEPLLNTLDAMLNENGVAWIGECGRANAGRFAEFAMTQDWNIESFDEHAKSCSNPEHMQFRMYVLKKIRP